MTRTALNPPELDLTARTIGDATVLEVSGELDIATADTFVAAVSGQLAERRPLILDLRRLAFMDSSGVRALDAVLREAERQGVGLTIGTTLQPGVRQILELTGLLAVLPLADLPDAG
jgi:anti-sigma B factor antagonist